MSIQDTLEYYAGLLIVQYRIKPNAIALVKLAANMGACDGLMEQEMVAFDLDTAVGVQLTVLGRIVGVPRSITGLDLEHEFFNFTRYVGSPDSIGFGRYEDWPWDELFQRYLVRSIYTLTDFELRALIKLKIVYNTKYSSLKNIKETLYSSFVGGINVSESGKAIDVPDEEFFNFTRYTDTPDSRGFNRYSDYPDLLGLWWRYSYSRLMFLTFSANPEYRNALLVAEFLKVVPAPMGVGYELVFT